jgi:predicted RNase H-like HicB family nuclease
MKFMKKKDYLNLPYHIVIQHITDESSSYYFARVQEFDGCMSHGDTYEEAFQNIREAMEGWIETKLENGFPVPEPDNESQYSGKFVLRLPKRSMPGCPWKPKEKGCRLINMLCTA